MTPRSLHGNKDPENVSIAFKTHKIIRIYKQNLAYTKDATLGISHAMTFTVPVNSHELKWQILDPNFSNQRVKIMEDGLYHELEQVLGKISEYGRRGEDVPILELYFCCRFPYEDNKSHIRSINRVHGDMISRYLLEKSWISLQRLTL